MYFSPTTISPEELTGSEPLSLGTREYFRARLRNRLYNFVVGKYIAASQKDENVTQKAMAARIRRSPAVINRYLKSPGNWTLDTVSDLLLAIGPEELDMSSSSVVGRPHRNESGRSALLDYVEAQRHKDQEGAETLLNMDPFGRKARSALESAQR